jgi:hypothetical protein
MKAEASRQPRPRSAREEHDAATTWTFLTIFVACLLIGLLLSKSHVFVVISSDRPGQSLIPASTIEPGTTASGTLTLSNDGLLPFAYSMGVTNSSGAPLPKGLKLQVRRLSDGKVIYDGPVDATSGTLGYLRPGEKVPLGVSVSLDKSFPAGVPINLTFIWTARASIFETLPWLVLIALAAFDIAITLLWFREVRRWRREKAAPALPTLLRPMLLMGFAAGAVLDLLLFLTGQADFLALISWTGLAVLVVGLVAVAAAWIFERRPRAQSSTARR